MNDSDRLVHGPQRVAKKRSRARGPPPALADPERAAAWPAVRAVVATGALRTGEAARMLGVSPSWVSRRVRIGDPTASVPNQPGSPS